MDLVGACRAFVAVSEHRGFTAGAAAAGMSQPVASRKIAALEQFLGEDLFERSTRRTRLTPFGQDLIPAARRLLSAADDLEYEAEAAKQRAFRLAIPQTCSTGDVAVLLAEARSHDIRLDVRTANPSQRQAFVHTREVRAAVAAVPESEASWLVPLGLAGAKHQDSVRVHVEMLRPSRSDNGSFRRMWLQPEDDVPHVRDRLRWISEAAGLLPAQLVVGDSLASATAEVLRTNDLVVCSRAQAEELGLRWWPIGEAEIVRGFALAAASEDDRERLLGLLGEEIGRCLGVPLVGKVGA